MATDDRPHDARVFAYPSAPAEDTADALHGRVVADPYRWLEGNVRSDERVRGWIAAENALTDDYLATLPARDAIRGRLTELWGL